jgi:hypothetical protein
VIANPLDSIDQGDEVRIVSGAADGRSEGGKDAASSPQSSAAGSQSVAQTAQGHAE